MAEELQNGQRIATSSGEYDLFVLQPGDTPPPGGADISDLVGVQDNVQVFAVPVVGDTQSSGDALVLDNDKQQAVKVSTTIGETVSNIASISSTDVYQKIKGEIENPEKRSEIESKLKNMAPEELFPDEKSFGQTTSVLKSIGINTAEFLGRNAYEMFKLVEGVSNYAKEHPVEAGGIAASALASQGITLAARAAPSLALRVTPESATALKAMFSSKIGQQFVSSVASGATAFGASSAGAGAGAIAKHTGDLIEGNITPEEFIQNVLTDTRIYNDESLDAQTKIGAIMFGVFNLMPWMANRALVDQTLVKSLEQHIKEGFPIMLQAVMKPGAKAGTGLLRAVSSLFPFTTKPATKSAIKVQAQLSNWLKNFGVSMSLNESEYIRFFSPVASSAIRNAKQLWTMADDMYRSAFSFLKEKVPNDIPVFPASKGLAFLDGSFSAGLLDDFAEVKGMALLMRIVDKGDEILSHEKGLESGIKEAIKESYGPGRPPKKVLEAVHSYLKEMANLGDLRKTFEHGMFSVRQMEFLREKAGKLWSSSALQAADSRTRTSAKNVIKAIRDLSESPSVDFISDQGLAGEIASRKKAADTVYAKFIEVRERLLNNKVLHKDSTLTRELEFNFSEDELNDVVFNLFKKKDPNVGHLKSFLEIATGTPKVIQTKEGMKVVFEKTEETSRLALNALQGLINSALHSSLPDKAGILASTSKAIVINVDKFRSAIGLRNVRKKQALELLAETAGLPKNSVSVLVDLFGTAGSVPMPRTSSMLTRAVALGSSRVVRQGGKGVLASAVSLKSLPVMLGMIAFGRNLNRIATDPDIARKIILLNKMNPESAAFQQLASSLVGQMTQNGMIRDFYEWVEDSIKEDQATKPGIL